MTKNELLKAIVPATKKHWENSHPGKTYSENNIYNCFKCNDKAMLESRYNTLKRLGYIE